MTKDKFIYNKREIIKCEKKIIKIVDDLTIDKKIINKIVRL